MLTLTLEDCILLLVIWLCSGIFTTFVFIRLGVLKWAGKSVIDRITHPDKQTEKAIDDLVKMILHSLDKENIDSGKKGEDGKPIMISSIDAIINRIAVSIMLRLRGLQGSVAKGAQSGEAALLGFSLPRKGQSTGEYLLEQLSARLMPVIEKKTEEFLNKPKGPIDKGGGW